MKSEPACFQSAFWSVVAGLLLASAVTPCAAQSASGSSAGDWRITPRLSVGTTYSDNIRLAPSGEAEGDWVWQVDPGLSIYKQGGRLNLRLDYTAQGLLYTQNGDANTINNNLLAFGAAELYQDHFFVDVYGSMSQMPITSSGRVDAGALGSNGATPSSLVGLFSNLHLGLPGAAELFNPTGIFSNIALTDNQTTQSTFGVSPYWRQQVGDWAEALLRYRYAAVNYSGSDNPTDLPDRESPDDLSNSRISTVEFNLTNGHRFSRTRWTLDYFYQQQDDSQDSMGAENGNNREEHVIGQADYRLTRAWALAAEAGYYNDQSTTDTENRNGPYWGLGATWTPNRFYTMTGLYGAEFNKLAAQWTPSLRTTLRFSRSDRQVGLNPGVYWDGVFSHRTRFSLWSASYLQEVTTSQQLAADNLAGGGDGQVPIPGPGGSFGVTNEQFLRKTFNGAVAYQRGRYHLGLNAFHESREFQEAVNDETTYGAGALWTWRFAPRTASFLGTGWEHSELGDDQQNDYWVSVIGLARVFNPDWGGLISYRYYQNDADPSDQGFRENRINARLSVKF